MWMLKVACSALRDSETESPLHWIRPHTLSLWAATHSPALTWLPPLLIPAYQEMKSGRKACPEGPEGGVSLDHLWTCDTLVFSLSVYCRK